jgi:hypothetical protein
VQFAATASSAGEVVSAWIATVASVESNGVPFEPVQQIIAVSKPICRTLARVVSEFRKSKSSPSARNLADGRSIAIRFPL